MRKFQAHTLGILQGDVVLFSDFEDDGDMWRGTGPRQMRKALEFDEPFLEVPIVQTGLTMWDIADEANSRADITAEKITATGFELVFRTWGDTRVARVRAEWLAIGRVANEDDFEF